jgi:ATP-dependent RNA helicase DDX5/DBP2
MHVVNYDFPTNIEDFVHRYELLISNLFLYSIGRTARGKASVGYSYTFFTQSKQDRNCAADLVQLMKEADQEIPPELQEMGYAKQQGGRNNNRWGGRGGSSRGGGRGGYGQRNGGGYGNNPYGGRGRW